MFSLDTVTSKNGCKTWPYRMLIIGPSGSGKANLLLDLIQQGNKIIDNILFVCNRFRRTKISIFD